MVDVREAPLIKEQCHTASLCYLTVTGQLMYSTVYVKGGRVRPTLPRHTLKGRSHEIDFNCSDKNVQNLALLKDAAGF
jgi:hypothetical protein